MHEPVQKLDTSAATAYEEFFVPALSRQWAPRVADAARIAPGQRVLDVACGTGVLAREVAARVDRAGSVTGLDPDAGMLAVAAKLAPEVDWRRGTGEAIPLPDESFDAVVSQFGLMFFADPRQALREMMRVLVPGGRIAIAVWDSLEKIPAYAAEVALVERVAGGRAADALRAPFALGDPDQLASLLRDAGASSVSVTTLAGVARFPSINAMVDADVTGWLPLVGVPLREKETESILRQADEAIGPSVRVESGIAFEMPAHIATGIKR